MYRYMIIVAGAYHLYITHVRTMYTTFRDILLPTPRTYGGGGYTRNLTRTTSIVQYEHICLCVIIHTKYIAQLRVIPDLVV